MSQPQLCPNHEWVESSLEDGESVFLLTFAISDVPQISAAPRPAVALAWHRQESGEISLMADFGQGLQVLFNEAVPPSVRQALSGATRLWVCGLHQTTGATDHIACAADLVLPELSAN